MASHPSFGYFFIRAAYEMSPDVLEILIDFGADLTRTNPSLPQYHSAMHAATVGRQLTTVQYLVSLGHSIDGANVAGETPLHLAVQTPGALAVARHLVELGADVNHEANSGQTPLEAAQKALRLDRKERSMLVELLLAHGAEGDINHEENGRGNSKGRMVLGIS